MPWRFHPFGDYTAYAGEFYNWVVRLMQHLVPFGVVEKCASISITLRLFVCWLQWHSDSLYYSGEVGKDLLCNLTHGFDASFLGAIGKAIQGVTGEFLMGLLNE